MLNYFLGKKSFQRVFEKMFNLSLRGMNYSSAKKYSDNGEKKFLKDFAAKYNNKHLVLFDVGANVGEYSTSIVNIFKSMDYTLYSFEPSYATFDVLKTKMNGASKLKLINKGLSSETKTIELHSDKEVSTLSSVYQRDLRHTDLIFANVEKIEVIRLDEFCQSENIEGIDFLKLDVEGHELEVLIGAKHLLDNHLIKVIQFEFGGCNIDSRTFFKDFYFLLEKDFNIYRIVRDGLRLIENYSEKLEIFQSSNFIAIHKKEIKNFF